jgi:hypothetical protein
MRNHATKNLHALGLAVCEPIILVLGAPNPLLPRERLARPSRRSGANLRRCWHPPERKRQGRLLTVQAALRRDQRTQRAPDRVGRKPERLARGWGP